MSYYLILDQVLPDQLTGDQRDALSIGVRGTFQSSPTSFSCPLAEHIEMDHERELAPGTTGQQLKDMHDRMHEGDPDHWDHHHRSTA